VPPALRLEWGPFLGPAFWLSGRAGCQDEYPKWRAFWPKMSARPEPDPSSATSRPEPDPSRLQTGPELIDPDRSPAPRAAPDWRSNWRSTRREGLGGFSRFSSLLNLGYILSTQQRAHRCDSCATAVVSPFVCSCLQARYGPETVDHSGVRVAYYRRMSCSVVKRSWKSGKSTLTWIDVLVAP
jgi:hypothetical protein